MDQEVSSHQIPCIIMMWIIREQKFSKNQDTLLAYFLNFLEVWTVNN